MRFRAQEALPIPIDEAVLDFQILSGGENAEGPPSKRVLLVVAYRDLVEAYVEACRLAGLRLVGVDLEAFALLRALTPPVATDPRGTERSALVAVSIGSERSASPSPTATAASTRACSNGAATSLTGSVARALELEADRAERDQGRARSKANRVPTASRRSSAEAREALNPGLQASAASSSPRSSSTRASRTRSASARWCSRAEPLSSAGWPRSSSSSSASRARGRSARRRLRRQEAQGRAEPGLRGPHRPRDGLLMADMKKEIKLSDLFRRAERPRRRSDVPEEEKPPEEERRQSKRDKSFSRKPKEPKEPKAPKAGRKRPAAELRSRRAAGAAHARLQPHAEGGSARGGRTSCGPAKLIVAVVGLVALAGLAAYFLLLNARVAGKTGHATS